MKNCLLRIALVYNLVLAGFWVPSHADMDSMNMAPTSTRDHLVTGVVEKLSDDKKTVSIHNDDIPGYMMAMTMDYKVNRPAELSGIKPGDKITFTLSGSGDDLLARNIKKSK